MNLKMSKIKIGILGFGRMGASIVSKADEFEIVCILDIKNIGNVVSLNQKNIVIENAEDIEKILSERKPDVVVDFTNPDACVKNAKVAAKQKINLVIGTTGLTTLQKEEIIETANKNNIGIVISPNMSIGVNVFWKLIKDAARLLKDYDIEIIEAHHKTKIDKPSGTALKMSEIVESETGKKIPIHSMRMGDIVGEHAIIFATTGERISIQHTAQSRDAFVNGVLKAIKFINNKKGIYDMNDVIGL